MSSITTETPPDNTNAPRNTNAFNVSSNTAVLADQGSIKYLLIGEFLASGLLKIPFPRKLIRDAVRCHKYPPKCYILYAPAIEVIIPGAIKATPTASLVAAVSTVSRDSIDSSNFSNPSTPSDPSTPSNPNAPSDSTVPVRICI